MSEVVLPLSLLKVRQLRDQLKALSRGLLDTTKVAMEQATCVSIAEDVRAGISSIQDVDGNYLGADTAAVSVEVGLPGHDVIWRGKQITYLEFGTGKTGAAGAYGGSAMAKAGYKPDPSKDTWAYQDNSLKEAVISNGLGPQAPMYNAGVAMRAVGGYGPAE